MSKFSMSLAGFIARLDDRTDGVHAWYNQDETKVKMLNNDLTFTTDPVSVDVI